MQTRAAGVRPSNDPAPLDAESPHPLARTYSRAYLHHLVKAGEMLGAVLLSAINLAYYQTLMAGMRAAIEQGRFASFRDATKSGWAAGLVAGLPQGSTGGAASLEP